ncbi:hypothetical protein ACGFJT_42335 [Actinomadura geliboluensis]|uniref:hypothetical protein n=1 Tax=Actinomadura geliboluensis TaxID=882440 RepID=UPI0037194C99
MAELHRVLSTANRTVDELDVHSPTADFDKAADQVWRVVLVAREMARPVTRTGCDEHPDGPVDPAPPVGWGKCLMCNGRRMTGVIKRGKSTSYWGVRPAPDQRELIELVPTSPEQGLRELRRLMERVNDLAFELHNESTVDQRDAVADEVHRAFLVLRELSRPVSITGCVKHPEGAVDQNPPAGWGKCLLCNTERHHADQANRQPLPRKFRRGSPKPRDAR